MIDPEPRIAHVARNTGQDVERAVVRGPEVVKPAAVAVGVQMGGEYHVDAEGIKERHEGPAFFGDALGALRAVVDAVLQHILVEQYDIPFFRFFCMSCGNQASCSSRSPGLNSSVPLRVEHDEVHGAVVKGIVNNGRTARHYFPVRQIQGR